MKWTPRNGNDGSGKAEGPHFSGEPFLLKLHYETKEGIPESEETYQLCYTCHDPHDATNTFQLRMFNNVTIPSAPGIEPTAKITDAGLSAVCMSCHNNRTNPYDAKAGVAVANPGPHYSSAAEQIAGVGGYRHGHRKSTKPHDAPPSVVEGRGRFR